MGEEQEEKEEFGELAPLLLQCERSMVRRCVRLSGPGETDRPAGRCPFIAKTDRRIGVTSPVLQICHMVVQYTVNSEQ